MTGLRLRYVFLCVVSIVAGVGPLAASERPPRYYDVHFSMDEVGLVVALPRNPAWQQTRLERPGPDALVLTSPPHFYPATTVQIQLHTPHRVEASELDTATLGFANEVRRQLGLSLLADISALEPVQYGDITGYADRFEKDVRDAPHDVKSVFGRFPDGEPISLMVSTPRGQLAHADENARRLWTLLQLLPATLAPFDSPG